MKYLKLLSLLAIVAGMFGILSCNDDDDTQDEEKTKELAEQVKLLNGTYKLIWMSGTMEVEGRVIRWNGDVPSDQTEMIKQIRIQKGKWYEGHFNPQTSEWEYREGQTLQVRNSFDGNSDGVYDIFTFTEIGQDYFIGELTASNNSYVMKMKFKKIETEIPNGSDITEATIRKYIFGTWNITSIKGKKGYESQDGNVYYEDVDVSSDQLMRIEFQSAGTYHMYEYDEEMSAFVNTEYDEVDGKKYPITYRFEIKENSIFIYEKHDNPEKQKESLNSKLIIKSINAKTISIVYIDMEHPMATVEVTAEKI